MHWDPYAHFSPFLHVGSIRLFHSRGRMGRQTLASNRVDEVPFVGTLTFPSTNRSSSRTSGHTSRSWTWRHTCMPPNGSSPSSLPSSPCVWFSTSLTCCCVRYSQDSLCCTTLLTTMFAVSSLMSKWTKIHWYQVLECSRAVFLHDNTLRSTKLTLLLLPSTLNFSQTEMQVEFCPRKVTTIAAHQGIFNNLPLTAACSAARCKKSHLFCTKLHLHLCCHESGALGVLKGAVRVKLSRKVVTEAIDK